MTAASISDAGLPLAPFALIDFPARRGTAAGALLLSDPSQQLVARTRDELLPLLHEVERAARRGLHAAGMVAYEACPAFDPALRSREPAQHDGHRALPLAWFMLDGAPRRIAPDALDALARAAAPTPSTWTPDTSRAEYEEGIAAIRAAIGRGDLYQVNHTLRFRAPAPAEPLALWLRLRRAQPGAYAAYLDLGDHQILSVSPELFFERHGTTITARPMKGTARRGRWVEEDDARAAALAASEKERAENVMIVDLLRNDLGRVAIPGTVAVPRLFEIERHPTVLQMTSTISGTAAPHAGIAALFAALFPCGSVTGAPKIAAAGAIAELEHAPRGAYCGAIGLVEPGGDCTFNVTIRTAHVDRHAGSIVYGAGGGITWDSRAEAEYDEVLAKTAVLDADWPEFALLETMRLEHGRIARLDRHLERLRGSARYFGFPATLVDAAAAELARVSADDDGAARRVRLLAHASGEVQVACTPAPPWGETAASPLLVGLAIAPVSRRDPFLHHKTTHRATYEQHRGADPEAFDVLLWNEEGEATEFTTGNLVAAIDGARYTPPRDCGLLGGTMRAELLARGEVRERVLHVHELARADGLWLVNSVRGMVPVTLRDSG